MTSTQQRVLCYSGIAFLVLLFPGVLMLGLLPPIAPSRTAQQVAEFWSINTGLKRCGIVLTLLGLGFSVPFGALIATRIERHEGRHGVWTNVEIIAVGLAFVAIVFPLFAFAAASYRPERNPQITQALNDLGWLPFVMNWPAAALQCLAVGFAVLGAPDERRTWPRWLGYFNLWCAFVFGAGGLVVLFKSGPFAWNGLLALWMVIAIFGLWFIVMTWQLLSTIEEEVLHP